MTQGEKQYDAPMERFFPPESMMWRVNREMALLAAGGRALLMQLGHPKVAAGVAGHSHFKEDPLGRLHRTMSTMWSIVFDEAAEASAALARVKNVHMKVRGAVAPGEALASGTPYDALDADLLLWVHATLIDSAIIAYDLFVEPLGAEEKARFHDDSKRLAYLFEIPRALVPATLSDFGAYMERMVAGEAVGVGPTARALAAEILYPRPWVLKPAGPLFRLITTGLLPAKLRESYGLDWNDGKQKRFNLAGRALRALLPFVPSPLRVVPNARRAERRALRKGVLA